MSNNSHKYIPVFLFMFSTLILSLRFNISAYENLISFERISVERGLAHGSVYSIIQDREGYLWFATGDGLTRFDGYGFKTYRYDPSDTDSIIAGQLGDLFQDSRGMIWVGTWGAGLDRFDPENNKFIHFDPDKEGQEDISNDRVEDIEEDVEGNIWAGIEKGGLLRFDHVSQTFKRFRNDPDDKHSLINDDVKVLYKDRKGNLWIGTNGGISKLIHEKKGKVSFRNFYHIPGDNASLGSNRVRALCEDSEGRIWIGTRGNGISILNPEGKTPVFSHILHIPGDNSSISENSIASLLRDSAGDVWIGTYNSGLNRLSSKTGKISRFSHDSQNTASLSHNRAEAIYEDRSQNLWIGTLGGGVNRLDLKEKKFKNYKYNSADKNSLPNSTVRSICEAGEEMVIGTEGGLALFNPDMNIYRHLKNIPGNINSISGNRIWSVISDKNGAIWAGTYLNGLNKIVFNNGKVKVTRFAYDQKDENSLVNNRIQVLYEDSDGDIWAGSSEGLNLLIRDGDRYKIKRLFESFSAGEKFFYGNNYIVSICQGSRGKMLIGTRGGLIEFEKETGEFSVFRHDPEDVFSLGSNFVLTITESINSPGIFWIGTSDGGLNRFSSVSGKFDRFYEKDGLPGNEVCGILEDDNGFLWISTNRGLSKFDPVRKKFRNYKRSSGIEGVGFLRNSSFRRKSGEMFFGSISGMVSFLPGKVKDNPNIPEIEITSFRKLGEEVELTKKGGAFDDIRLAHNENFITIEFAALDFTNVKDNRYSYFLKGVDYDWVNSDSRRSVNYNHLKPGTYKFNVKGSNNDGIWNEEGISLKIVLVPAFWQTWWFRTLLFFTAVFLVIFFYKFRVNDMKRTNRKLSELNSDLNREIGNRIIAEEAMRESELSYKTLFLNANDIIFLLKDGIFTRCNEKTPGIFGYKNENEIVGKNIFDFFPDVQLDGIESSYFNTFIEEALNGTPQRFNWSFKKKDGAIFDSEISLNRLELGKNLFIQVILRDITEQKRMQERLAVTQKMESIGELTGGIAHDFNNILTAMNGYAEMALGILKPDEKPYRFVSNILKSGNQAVELVQKLLGFSRQQIISPRIININRSIRELNEMLVRLIGEDIELGYVLKDNIRSIKADITQIEQLIINLIINSRDAVNKMDRKDFRKKISLETDETFIDDEFMKNHSGIVKGNYVVLSVIDNGVGMKREVQDKIFEPFFTTKGPGKGTGLGMSTVYGIVKQNMGAIYVYSEESLGTTVKVYWPVSEEPGETESMVIDQDEVPGGNETILFVEDDDAVRELSTTILKSLGYKVHSASNGIEALKLIESGVSEIDLLITDVIMPKMGGKELERNIRGLIPGIRILFASGYTDNYIVHSGVLEKGVNFIQKPFSLKSIGNKIREVLSDRD